MDRICAWMVAQDQFQELVTKFVPFCLPLSLKKLLDLLEVVSRLVQ